MNEPMTDATGASAGEADSFQRDLDRHMQDPEFRRSYEEQTRQLEIGAAERARAALASSSRRTRFGRVFVEHLLAECDAATERAETAERALAEMRERIGVLEPTEYEYRANGPFIYQITDVQVSTYPDGWADDYWPERRQLRAGAWERLDGGEWKAVDGD